MKKIRIEDAVGTVLGHDVSEIIPGKYKGPRFKRGHKIRETIGFHERSHAFCANPSPIFISK